MMGQVSSLGACSGLPAQDSSAAGPSPGIEGPPVASIHYGFDDPREHGYPFSSGTAGPRPSTGDTVYVSPSPRGDTAAKGVTFSWLVIEPGGGEVMLTPSAGVAEASFRLSRAGRNVVTLQVRGEGDLESVAHARLELDVRPWTCAADGRGPTCQQSLPVSGGTFRMGSLESEGDVTERPAHPATLSDFSLDRFEVTVGRFRAFLEENGIAAPAEGSGALPGIPASGWRSSWDAELATSFEQLHRSLAECGSTWTPSRGEKEALPVSCISWYEAFAFCIWDGGRLPTEGEWEYAARGGAEQRTFPWGDASPTPSLAVWNCSFDAHAACYDTDLPPVGNAALGAGRFGHQDLAGSLWEWVFDRYAPYASDACNDCARTDSGEGRVFRGGDYGTEDATLLRGATRLGFYDEYRDPTRGFRCARGTTARANP